jgi:hypothetical protein
MVGVLIPIQFHFSKILYPADFEIVEILNISLNINKGRERAMQDT